MTRPTRRWTPVLLLLLTSCAGDMPASDGQAGDGSTGPGGDSAPGVLSGCFEQFDRGGHAFDPPSADLFAGETTVAIDWEFRWDGEPRGRHQLNELRYLEDQGRQRLVADGSSLVLHRAFSPHVLPVQATLSLQIESELDISQSGTPESQDCSESDAAWVEILMTNDIAAVERAIVWKNDGSRDGSYVLSEVCPRTDPDSPASAPCYIGIKVGAHQDGKNTDDKFPCALGAFINQVEVSALCLE